MPATAVYPAPSRPASFVPAEVALQTSLRIATGCANCCVRAYCALATPDSLCPPTNCPFGLGPAAR